jgi:hypothetical protein
MQPLDIFSRALSIVSTKSTPEGPLTAEGTFIGASTRQLIGKGPVVIDLIRVNIEFFETWKR